MATVELALETITATNLSPTEHLLLKHFVEGAVHPATAAEYLLSRVQTSNDSVEDSLRELKQQWRSLASRLTAVDPIPPDVQDLVRQRDGADFALRRNPSHVPGSNIEPAFVIPPSMVQVVDSAEQGSLLPLLEAFLSVDRVTRLRNLLDPGPEDNPTRLKNLLSLPPSIHKAFRAGHVDIRTRDELAGGPPPGCEPEYPESCGYGMRKQYPEEVSGLYVGDGTPFDSTFLFFQLSTSDAKRLCLPSSFLINIHFRFATALHLFYVEDKAARGWPSPSIGLSVPGVVSQSFRWLWLRLPEWLRVPCYMLLKSVGLRMYPLEAGVWAQRLPFGLYMKQCTRAPKNEPNVLRLIEKHTTIPAPRLIDAWETDGKTNIIMTRLPGTPIGEVCHLMSYPERDRFAKDLKNCVEQLRKIPNTTPYLICDTLGGPIADHRIPRDTGGPFKTETDFNNHLSIHLKVPFSKIVELKNLPARDHQHFYLTHSDFHPSNLLVERGRLSAIVDWESAGFRPEYWEFTKAMYGAMGGHVMSDIFWRTFGREYETELEVERQLWYLTPFGV
ncbi:kinase-like domain-containing protein [Aspergillus varians]